MTHQDAGKYSAKHPAGTVCDPVVAEAVRQKAENKRITCSAAHALAADLGVPPAEIGKTIDLLEYRITRCQLGLFGYSPDKKIVNPDPDPPEALQDLVHQSRIGDKISCAVCWEIAEKQGLKKMAVSAVCEFMGIKISPCQLGAF